MKNGHEILRASDIELEFYNELKKLENFPKCPFCGLKLNAWFMEAVVGNGHQVVPKGTRIKRMFLGCMCGDWQRKEIKLLTKLLGSVINEDVGHVPNGYWDVPESNAESN